jgi:hypothetical protein
MQEHEQHVSQLIAEELRGIMSNWQEVGACSGTDPEAFFPEYNRDAKNQQEQILDALNALQGLLRPYRIG